MTRTVLFLCLVLTAATGCSLTFGERSRQFTVTALGTGATTAEAIKAAREDAAEQVRQMGYTDFRLEPNGSTSSATTTGHSEVSMGFRVITTPESRFRPGKKVHSHDTDFCSVCNHKKTCQCSEAAADSASRPPASGYPK